MSDEVSAKDALNKLKDARDDAKHPDLSQLIKLSADFHYSLSQESAKQTEISSQTADKNLLIANRAYIVSLVALGLAFLQFINAFDWINQRKGKFIQTIEDECCQTPIAKPVEPPKVENIEGPPLETKIEKAETDKEPATTLTPSPEVGTAK